MRHNTYGSHRTKFRTFSLYHVGPSDELGHQAWKQQSNHWAFHQPNILRSWRDDSVVKSSGCFSKGSTLIPSTQIPGHSCLWLVSGYRTPLFWCSQAPAHTRCAYSDIAWTSRSFVSDRTLRGKIEDNIKDIYADWDQVLCKPMARIKPVY